MFNTIIFDLDYTLYNESNYINKCFNSSNLFKNNVKLRYELRINSRNFIKDTLKKKKCYSKKNSNIIFNNLKKQKMKIFLYSGFLSLFKILKEKKIKIGLLTNGNPLIQKNKIKNLKIEKYFDSIIFARKFDIQKPNKKAFYKILKILKSEPKKSLFIGDHIENDIEGAKSIGMRTLWVNHKKVKNINSDFMVYDPNFTSKKILQLIR